VTDPTTDNEARSDPAAAVSAEAPVDPPVDSLADPPAEAPAEAPVDAPAEAPVDAPAEAPVDAPVDPRTDPTPPRRPRQTGPVQYKGEELEPERGPGLGCFRIQLVVLAIFIVLTPLSVAWDWPSPVSAGLLFTVILLLLFTGQTVIFLLRLVAADRRGRRRPLASATKTVGELEEEEVRVGDAGEIPPEPPVGAPPEPPVGAPPEPPVGAPPEPPVGAPPEPPFEP